MRWIIEQWGGINYSWTLENNLKRKRTHRVEIGGLCSGVLL